MRGPAQPVEQQTEKKKTKQAGIINPCEKDGTSEKSL